MWYGVSPELEQEGVMFTKKIAMFIDSTQRKIGKW
jgi:hypothetical protein